MRPPRPAHNSADFSEVLLLIRRRFGSCFPQRFHRGSLSEWISGSIDAGIGVTVRTRDEARTALRLAVRTNGNERKAGIRAIQKPGIAPRGMAPLELRDDHELRAALICLLTVALAAQGTAATEPRGGGEKGTGQISGSCRISRWHRAANVQC